MWLFFPCTFNPLDFFSATKLGLLSSLLSLDRSKWSSIFVYFGGFSIPSIVESLQDFFRFSPCWSAYAYFGQKTMWLHFTQHFSFALYYTYIHYVGTYLLVRTGTYVLTFYNGKFCLSQMSTFFSLQFF